MAETDDTEIDLQAARWVERRLGASPDAATEAAFDAWLAGDPRRVAAYERMARAWSHPDLWAASSFEAARDAVPRRRTAKPLYFAAAAAAAVGLAGFVAVTVMDRPYQVVLATGPGEVRTLTLPEGTSVALSGRSRLEVRIDGRERLLRLLEGEALVAVAHDARPLVVRTAMGEARALGTRFNVDVHSAFVEVGVLEGLVEVSGAGARLRLAAGRSARLTPAPVEHPARPEQAAAWRDGWVETGSMPLGLLAEELSRFSAKPILISDDELAREEIAGRFSLANSEETLETLAVVYALKVQEHDSHIVIEPSQTR